MKSAPGRKLAADSRLEQRFRHPWLVDTAPLGDGCWAGYTDDPKSASMRCALDVAAGPFSLGPLDPFLVLVSVLDGSRVPK